MRRFVRFAAIGFALFSAVFWDAASSLFSLVQDYPDALDFDARSYWGRWLVYGLPVILYGLLSVLYFHWFARRVARMAIPRK